MVRSSTKEQPADRLLLRWNTGVGRTNGQEEKEKEERSAGKLGAAEEEMGCNGGRSYKLLTLELFRRYDYREIC